MKSVVYQIGMKTVVHQRGTNNKYIYNLPPEIAVVDAYYQYEKKKFNTWEYDYSLVRYSATAKTVYCGDFSARVKQKKR